MSGPASTPMSATSVSSLPDASLPVVRDRAQFDERSGSLLERAIFNYRLFVILACLVVTIVLGWQTSALVVNASFEKLLPGSHPYAANYRDNRQDLRALGNQIRIAVENPRGDIFDPHYLETLKRINDELFLIPGVDRAWMKSLWTPSVRWTEVTEEGFRGGPVMPDRADGSPASIAQLRVNILRAGVVGSLVARDFKSSTIVVPLLDRTADGKPLDYGALSTALEEQIRSRYAAGPDPQVKVHIIGFAKLMGDLIDGVTQVIQFFALAVLMAAVLVYWHTRCTRSTLLLLSCSLIAVVWQLGLIVLLGHELNPYSVLVPFLVFAIGVSHGAQKMNGIKQDVAMGTHRYVAARYTFRRLFLAGLAALLADVVAFAVLMFIDIPVIRGLALIASIGVGVLIFTNLVLLPVLLSCVGVSPRAADTLSDSDPAQDPAIVRWLCRFTERRWALAALTVSAVVTAAAFAISLQVRVGDVDAGAPELRPDSRYNRDVAFFNANYGLSSDQFAVIVKTPPGGCEKFETLVEIDRLSWTLQQLPAVQSVQSLPDVVRQTVAGANEGNPKWLSLSRNRDVINSGTRGATVSHPELMNFECAVTPVIANLVDHKAETLTAVLTAVEAFAAQHNTGELQFLPVAGTAGIEAVTNIVVARSNREMLAYVYGAVVALCLLSFRSWRAMLVAVIPLAMTSVLCEALMVALGIGIKVATLPVVALGVGIGVDYALYLLSVQLAQQRAGAPLAAAYRHALLFTGKVVALVGITLAAGVATWALSPIKFQADMGVLLSFMFVWNMVGALLLIPALSHFLLAGISARARVKKSRSAKATSPNNMQWRQR
jgi:predicted RND superfamily exporter protein